ncbi:MAG: polysaccharide biosynthesis/export family protein [Elainellaceae cyanobacterium]
MAILDSSGSGDLMRILLKGVLLSGVLILLNPLDARAQTEFETQIRLESGGSESRYILGAGDRLQIDVFNVPEYSGSYQVLADGYLSLPMVGTVRLEGLTLDQASERISQQLSQVLRRPLVTVRLLEARPITLAIAGEVNRPGTYTLTAEEASVSPTVTHAIQIAGGITQSADIRQIQVRRSQPDGQESREIEVNLWSLLRDGDLRQDVALRDRDTIVVPLATDLSPEETTQLATANFSPDQMTVNVVGEVDSPGAVQIPPNTPLNQAILAAGGFNNRARRKTVELVRLNPNGTVTRQDIEVDFEQSVNDETNPPLRPYDTVIVGRSGLARISDVFGSIISITSVLRLLGI